MNNGENNTNINSNTNMNTGTNINANANANGVTPSIAGQNAGNIVSGVSSATSVAPVQGASTATTTDALDLGTVTSRDNNSNLSNTTSIPPVAPSSVESRTINPGVNMSTNIGVSTDNGGQGLNNMGINNDPNGMVNEKLKQVDINYTPPSKLKTFMMIFMFILLIAFVIFLPEITSMVNQYKANKNKVPEKIITTGSLECTLKSNTTNLDMEYLRIFKFTDSKLYEATYNLTTRGDITLDENTLDNMAEKCNNLAQNTKDLAGVTISCDYSDGKLVEKQNYIFASINFNKLDAAFTEAGGTYIEFNDGQEIDSIEKTMNAAGFSCMRKEQ